MRRRYSTPCGAILAFVLLNIEIADYFTKPGAYELTFHFSGNFARDMSYSIAWALFALLLLIVGIRKRNKAAPLRQSRLAWLRSPKALFPRSLAAPATLPHRSAHRCRDHRNFGVVLLSTFSRSNRRSLGRNESRRYFIADHFFE